MPAPGDATLITTRLRLAPCSLADLDALHALWTDADVRRYLWDDEHISRDLAATVIRSSLESFANYGFGQWAVRKRGGPEVIGFSGLRSVGGGTDIELLYGFAPLYWKKGFATEAATAVVAYAFEKLGLPRVVASADVPNAASAHVLERLGMQCSGEQSDHRRRTVSYALTATAYRLPNAPESE